MVFDHMIKFGGIYYAAGEDVPMEEKNDAPEIDVPVEEKIEIPETKSCLMEVRKYELYRQPCRRAFF